jgi:hypothetical protein
MYYGTLMDLRRILRLMVRSSELEMMAGYVGAAMEYTNFREEVCHRAVGVSAGRET